MHELRIISSIEHPHLQDRATDSALHASGMLLSAVLVAQAERNVVEAMTQCQKPDMAGLQQLVTPVGTEIQAADCLTQVTILSKKVSKIQWQM